MSTLPLNVPHVPQPITGFGRVIATVIDVFTEAQQQAIAAHKCYPFIDW